MIKALLLVTLCVAVLVYASNIAVPSEEEIKKMFVKFVHKYEKLAYEEDTLKKRYSIFRENVIRASVRNQMTGRSIANVTKFMDLTVCYFPTSIYS
jgi:hypothetical protein